MATALGLLNVKSNTTASPSVALAGAMVATVGARSLSSIVPIALTAPLWIVNVSSNSSIVSCVVGTLTVPVVTPAATFTVTSVVV